MAFAPCSASRQRWIALSFSGFGWLAAAHVAEAFVLVAGRRDHSITVIANGEDLGREVENLFFSAPPYLQSIYVIQVTFLGVPV